MAKYRKKPIIVEAEQFFPDKKPWSKGVHAHCQHLDNWIYYVITIHGQKTPIEAGDWIIEGERYPCKPDIFVVMYEKVDE